MEFYDITEEDKVSPGEYILHKPTQAVVLCGIFSREADEIKALNNGKLIEDIIKNFQKIKIPKKEIYRMRAERGCGGCKKV
tara:strand:+ start:1260 stop:1502 length:243 start_codon:yes stop_codon:yes gene_type:complete